MTDKQKTFLDKLFGEAKGDIRKAMDLAGYSKDTALSDVTKPLAKEIEERTRRLIADGGPKSVFAMMTILEGKDPDAFLGAKERIAVAKDLLDRAGISKTEKLEVETKSPLFILPSKKPSDDED